jgi:hypothetical protein
MAGADQRVSFFNALPAPVSADAAPAPAGKKRKKDK